MSNSVFVKRVSVLFITENIIHKSKEEKTPERDNQKKAKHTGLLKSWGDKSFHWLMNNLLLTVSNDDMHIIHSMQLVCSNLGTNHSSYRGGCYAFS